MKEMNEYKAEIFSRMEKGIKERKRKRRRILTYGTPLCLCLVMLISLSIWQSGFFKQPIDVNENDSSGYTNDGEYDGVWSEHGSNIDEGSIIWGEQTKGENNDFNNGYKTMNRKIVSVDLFNAMQKAKSTDIFAVSVGNTKINSFVYNGKTLKEWEDEVNNLTLYRKKLALLLKEGEILAGKKISDEAYKNRIEFYGEEFLSTYIVDGKFLVDKVEEDITAYSTNDVEKASLEDVKKAEEAYCRQVLEKTFAELQKQKVNCRYSSNGLNITIFVTVKQFENLNLENIDDYLFSFQTKNDAVVSEPNIK